MKYTVRVIERHCGDVEVEADTVDEAIAQAIEKVKTDFECTEDAFVLWRFTHAPNVAS